MYHATIVPKVLVCEVMQVHIIDSSIQTSTLHRLSVGGGLSQVLQPRAKDSLGLGAVHHGRAGRGIAEQEGRWLAAWEFPNIGGSIFVSWYEGSYFLGSILGAPESYLWNSNMAASKNQGR